MAVAHPVLAPSLDVIGSRLGMSSSIGRCRYGAFCSSPGVCRSDDGCRSSMFDRAISRDPAISRTETPMKGEERREDRV